MILETKTTLHGEPAFALVPQKIDLANLDYIWNRARFSPGDSGGYHD